MGAKRTHISKLKMSDLCGPIAEVSPIPIAALEGADGVIGYANPAFCLLAGKAGAELVGQALAAIAPVDEEFLSLLARVYRTGLPESHMEESSGVDRLYRSYSMWPILRAGGHVAGVILMVTETTSGHERMAAINQALLVSSVRQHQLTEVAETANARLEAEVIERKRVEEQLNARNIELTQSHKLARAIVETVQQPLLVLDQELCVKSANPAFYECFQTAQENIEGHLLYLVDNGKWDIPELRSLLSEVLPVEKTFDSFEVAREFSKVGHKILLIGARQVDHFQLILLSLEDITARRAAEEALKHSQTRLRHAQQMEAIGRLAGGVAHDFNNILTVILGYGRVLSDSLSGEEKEQQRSILQYIIESAVRASELTRELLAFGRRQVLQPRHLKLQSVVADMEPMLRRVIGESIHIVIDCEAPGGVIYADPAQTTQVIMNLALNARDAMIHGGTLTLGTKVIDIPPHSPGDDLKAGRYVVLTVIDTGIGMDKETQSHIFEPFFTTKEQGLGTGLGMSTVLGIVEQSGGHIRLASEPGHGTTFEIFFPSASEPEHLPEAQKGERPAPPDEAPAGSGIVLLAEDEMIVRQLLCQFLDRGGYKVLEARDGVEGLAICEKYPHIDLLVTDVKMPKMGGRELAEKAALLHPEMSIILMSGYMDDEKVAEGVKKGTLFLQKPFNPLDLVKKVRDVLDARRKHRNREGNPPVIRNREAS
jgi:signal transduction histidine kinase/CheY-like chemotaxis protein